MADTDGGGTSSESGGSGGGSPKCKLLLDFFEIPIKGYEISRSSMGISQIAYKRPEATLRSYCGSSWITFRVSGTLPNIMRGQV